MATPIDVLVVIVAERYGWVPPDQEDPKDKSITWLECLEAEKCDIPILGFLLDWDADWDVKRTEAYRLAEAALAGMAPPTEEVQRNMKRLKDFKAWVDQHCTRVTFKNPDHLASEVGAALSQWRLRHPEFQDVELPGDPTRYLRALEQETALLEIRGLVGDATAKTFAIEDLYIPLRSTALPEQDEKDEENRRPADQEVGERLDLDRALAQSRLVVVGDPGASKTTFLRRVAHLACRGYLQDDASILDPLGLKGESFPILVKLWELQQHIATQHERREEALAKRPFRSSILPTARSRRPLGALVPKQIGGRNRIASVFRVSRNSPLPSTSSL